MATNCFIIINMNISEEFPFESRYVEINGSNIHYIDEGEGDPILFLHGNPTSSYLWRNIIPYLKPVGRCIAPDLIGMGRSDKPKLKYTFFDHYKYFKEFIDKLGLKNITLVIHDWGSGLGFHYAMNNEDNIKGIAFMEALVKPFKWKEIKFAQRIIFRLFRIPFIGWKILSFLNFFVKILLPNMVVRKLTKKELKKYSEPFKTLKSRKPVRMWPKEVPFNGKPEATYKMMNSYSKKLQESDLPKILFYADPGAIIDENRLKWCKYNLKNLTTVYIGPGLHYIQEDNPHLIGEKILEWYRKLN